MSGQSANSETIISLEHTAVLQRISVLEERTDPKNRSLIDIVKEYAGFFALLISLLYSFPMGIWDRFFETPEIREAELIDELKNSLSHALQIVSDTAYHTSLINVPDLRDAAGRAGSTRVLLLMSRNEENFKRYYTHFTKEELLAIGLNFQFSYQPQKSLYFFEKAKDASEIHDLVHMEAVRQIAKYYFQPSEHQNLEKGRSIFKDMVDRIPDSNTQVFVISEINARSDWALLELYFGDWSCGQKQFDISIGLIDSHPHYLNDGGNTRLVLQHKAQNAQKRLGQPDNGC